jgi:transcriptional/translational regulatory protein YebC/TACO1
MSGHNKFSKIKHIKAKNDAQKSKLFGKLVRLITVEAKKAKGILTSPGLANAIEKAKQENMPNDTIDRAIKKSPHRQQCSNGTSIVRGLWSRRRGYTHIWTY